MSLSEVSPVFWGNYTLEKKNTLSSHFKLLKAFGVGSISRVVDLTLHPLVEYTRLGEESILMQAEQTVFGAVTNTYDLKKPFQEKTLTGSYCVSSIKFETPTRLVHKLKNSDNGKTMECVKDFDYYGFTETCKTGDVESIRTYRRIHPQFG